MSVHSEALAIAAHLHVLLRRKTGRVTDTEWMASNPEYAHAIVAFARDQANGDGLTELQPWADKLEALIPRMGTAARKPLIVVAAERFKTPSPEAHADERPAPNGAVSGFRDSRIGTQVVLPVDKRYVGGIR